MDTHKYLSAVTLSMCAKIGFEDTPLINIVSKLDLLKKLGRPQMNLIDLENIGGIHYLFWGEGDSNKFNQKYGKLNRSLCEVIENYMCMDGYLLLDITSRELICHIVGKIDKANGYFDQPEKVKNPKEAAIDYQAVEWYVSSEAVQDLYDKYIDTDEEYVDPNPPNEMTDATIEKLTS